VNAGCAAASRAAGERPLGTASRARRWVLVEQPGAWGSDAIASSDLPDEVADHLRGLAATLPARVLLLRRPGGDVRLDTRRAVFAGVSTPSGGWLEHLEVDHVRDLVGLDLRGIAGPEATTTGTVGGRRLTAPLYLVCTNGKHDPCCATEGLPVARALATLLPERVWECSHVGGDRFAGNLVCLPDGLYYGHLDPDTARAVVAATEGGRLVLDRWRGRSALPFAAQAAEGLVREELGIDALGALHVVSVRRVGTRHEVLLRGPGGREHTAVVEVGRDDQARPLTCGADPGRAPRYELVELR
jgi:hypothetical protein